MNNVLIDINKQKCTNCKTCVEVCPVNMITSHKNGYVTIIPELTGNCMKCGQCEAFCQYSAISIEYDTAQKYQGKYVNESLNPEHLVYHMANRRSIRNFKNSTVKEDVLNKIMEVARYAPTAGNSQNIKWMIIHDRKKIDNFLDVSFDWIKHFMQNNLNSTFNHILQIALSARENGEDMICRNAPHLILAYSDDTDKNNPYAASIPIDATIGISYIELVAVSYGLGTCWAGFVNILAGFSEKIKESLGIKEGYSIYGALMIGYPKFKQKRIPKRNQINLKWL